MSRFSCVFLVVNCHCPIQLYETVQSMCRLSCILCP